MTALQLSFKKLPCISVGLIILQTIPHVTLLFCQIADNLGENTVKQSICRTRFVELLEYVPQWNGTSSNNPYMVHVKTCYHWKSGKVCRMFTRIQIWHVFQMRFSQFERGEYYRSLQFQRK